MTSVLFPTRPLISRYWSMCRDADPGAFELFQRHYSYKPSKNRKKAGGRFIGPGECLLLITPMEDAIIGFRFELFRRDSQEGVNCCFFRNESPVLSSSLLLDAESPTREKWPDMRLFTFVDPRKIRSKNPGCCFVKAGWSRCGRTAKGLFVFEKRP